MRAEPPEPRGPTSEAPVAWKDGRRWRVGTGADIDWIRQATAPGLSIASAMPLVYDAYATVVVPPETPARAFQLSALIGTLTRHASGQPWWLGYLDTGADDVVIPAAPRVLLYADWRYVLVLASAREASAWRSEGSSSRAPGPDLVFPADRS